MQSRISDPVRIYHPDHSPREVWRVDMSDYLAIGWSLSPVDDLAKVTIPDPMPATPPITDEVAIADPLPEDSTIVEVEEVEIDPKTQRTNELKAIISANGGWEKIKAIAATHDITQKPKGGWDDAIDLIIAAEFPEVA